jgi:hypothetical protein
MALPQQAKTRAIENRAVRFMRVLHVVEGATFRSGLENQKSGAAVAPSLPGATKARLLTSQ